MNVITKYQSEDGAEFTSADACSAYEALVSNVREIMERLPERPDLPGCEFQNGGGYVQHNTENVLSVRKALLELAAPYCTYVDWVAKAIDDTSIHPSWPSRIIGEACPSPLSHAWYRFMCMDSEWREWGQPYYANNPDRATQKRLN